MLIQPGALEDEVVRLLRDAEDPVSALEAHREEHGLALSFWAETVPAEVGHFVREHPCGDTLTALVKNMPKAGDETFLVAERVLELGSDGAVVRQWHMPIDSVVVGVRGDSLLSQSPVAVAEGAVVVGLAIQPNGQIRVVPKEESSAVAVSCPPLPFFGASDYLHCWRFADLGSGRQRLLAYQSPCV